MTKKDQVFISIVYEYYAKAGRHDLPWRQTTDPYAILVSELMLQQTQVSRALPKYKVFLDTFPSWQSLADAPLGVVLQVWQGLGYNRRAKLLHQCARMVVQSYNGQLPQIRAALEALPGIGPYTAGAVMAFAYNLPVVMIETNIRTVYIHHYVQDGEVVTDKQLLVHIERTLDQSHARQWYAALMDYGSYLKQTIGNKSVQSAHYQKQAPFIGSRRAIRGAVLRVLSQSSYNTQSLHRLLSQFEPVQLDEVLGQLRGEGLVEYRSRRWQLPGINNATRHKNSR
jgi:A/G-specific adenine glycosylase